MTKMFKHIKFNNRFLTGLILLFLFIICFCTPAIGQEDTVHQARDSVAPYDVGDLFRSVFKKKSKDDTTKAKKNKGMVLLPSLGYNPSFGFFIGATITGGKQLGSKENTSFSIFNLSGSISTNGMITFKARHNISTPFNKWNLQGDWEISRMGVVDYGPGVREVKTSGLVLNELSTKNSDSAYPMRYKYIKLFEKAYRSLGSNMYAGAGIGFDIVFGIEDEKLEAGKMTPHQIYSTTFGFDTSQYSANGLLFNFLYNTRDHPLRAYKGIYADINFRFNVTWMGSKENSTVLLYDFRKYWSLSKRSPEHVLALWHWASYDLSGDIPYLILPGTADDMFGRSGRGYTFGRFKGPSYACFEGEWRFPITRNKFISGVGFFNFQTASNGRDQNIFSVWAPAGGFGVRILFDKENRTNLCVDFAYGQNGAKGVFFGLNEVF